MSRQLPGAADMTNDTHHAATLEKQLQCQMIGAMCAACLCALYVGVIATDLSGAVMLPRRMFDFAKSAQQEL